MVKYGLRQCMRRGRVEHEWNFLLLAQIGQMLHRLDRYFQLRKHNPRAANCLPVGIQKTRCHLRVGTGSHNDAVLPARRHCDHGYARRAFMLLHRSDTDTCLLKIGEQLFAERIRTHLADELHGIAKASYSYGLVSAFPSRVNLKITAADSFTRNWNFLSVRHEIDIDTAHHNNRLWTGLHTNLYLGAQYLEEWCEGDRSQPADE